MWPSTYVVDVYCPPGFWEHGWALLGELALPAAQRYVAYNDQGCRPKGHMLLAAGFRPVALHHRRVAPDRARTNIVDVEVWERA